MFRSLASLGDVLMPWSGFFLGFFTPVSIDAHRREAYVLGEVTAYIAASGLLGMALWWQMGQIPGRGWAWLLCAGCGAALAFWWFRSGVSTLDEIKDRLTKRSGLARVGRTDVRTVAAELPLPRKEYDPRQFHRIEDFFLGTDGDGQPVYWGRSLPHMSISGTSGSGKGRKLQDLSAQSILNGEALFYLDPKDDEWGAHALFTACREHSTSYHYLRLLPESPPQINLLAGAKSWQIEEMFHATFGLADTGSGSDFYRAKDRAAAHATANIAAIEQLTAYSGDRDQSFWRP